MSIARIWKIGVAVLLLAGCGTSQPTATPPPTVLPTATAEQTIVVGDISDDAIEAIEEAQPLADYLAANLGEFDILEGRVRIAASIQEMAEMLESGEVDLYFDSVFPATVASDISGGELFLRRWKDGVAEYHTVIFANGASGVSSVEELPGHMVAFEEDFSTSGYVLPLAYLVEQGLNPVERSEADASVGSDEIGYVFSGAHANSVGWVLSGRVDAAATENGDFEDLEPEVRDQLVVLAETESLPRHVGIASPEMEPEVREAIAEVLMSAHETEDGRAALEQFSETARFDEFPEGIDQAVERMRELLEIVQAEQDAQ